MNPFVTRLADSGSDPSSSVPARGAAEASEREALDAYSRVIVTVAETLGPAVVNLRAIAGRGRPPPRRLRIRLSVHAGRFSLDQPPCGSRLEPGARPAQ